MTKAHSLSLYQDGYIRVEFCKVCGAEGLRLLEPCPQKIINPVEKTLDDKQPKS